MKIIRLITKAVLFVYYLFRYSSPTLAFHFANNNIHPRKCQQVTRQGATLFFAKTGSALPIQFVSKYFSRSMHYMVDILNNTSIKSINENAEGITLSTDELSVYVNTESSAGNFYEIITRKMYDFQIPADNLVVVDIGMNAGLASLYFASKASVRKVYAFEPFSSTVANARKNLELNPAIKNKIIIHNAGVSNKSGTISVPFFEGGSLEASINDEFLSQHNFSSIDNSRKIDIEVLDIREVINMIAENEKAAGPYTLVLKVDCEGEEYAIFDTLDQSGLSENIAAFLMEWHHKGPDPLIKILNKHNFRILSCPITTVDGSLITDAGMLYAFK